MQHPLDERVAGQYMLALLGLLLLGAVLVLVSVR